MGDKIWNHVTQTKASIQHYCFVETHIGRADIKSWDVKARAEGLKLFCNPARPSRKDARELDNGHANEGGEWIITHGHLRVHSLSLASAPMLQSDGSQSNDGFCAVLVHMKGYSFVLVTFYGYCSYGFTGPNIKRYRRLGALLYALQLPWVVVADFNISAAAINKAEFVSRIGGHILTANVDYTCNKGEKGSHIDFV
eukprot:3593595-Pyramimonas_sp.AAC.1